MEDRGKVSIVIPIYNSSVRIEECVESVIRQTYRNIEIILVNDGSTDNTKEIIDELSKKDSRIKVIHKENRGVSSARNTGIDISTGEFISFVDSDDYVDENYLECLLKYQEQYQGDIVRCNYYNNNIPKEVIPELKIYDINNEKELLCDEILSTYKFNYVWAQIIKKETLLNYKFDENLKMGEDFIFNVDIILNSRKVVVIPEILYHYYYNEKGMNYNKDKEKLIKKINDINYIYEKLLLNEDFKKRLIYKRAIDEIFPHIADLSRYSYKQFDISIENIRQSLFIYKQKIDRQDISKCKYYWLYILLERNYRFLLFIISKTIIKQKAI